MIWSKWSTAWELRARPDVSSELKRTENATEKNNTLKGIRYINEE
jgi:hypothetical protein